MVDVFISYSRDNKARVADIAAAVAAAGYDVWWDAELPPHRSYGDVIAEKIAGAKAAIVVWSQTSAQSEWVRAEADVARNQKKLVQTAIDDVMPPLPFNQIQFADLSDWNGDTGHSGWRKVLMSLEDLCGREAAAPTPPARSASPPPALATPPTQKSSFLPWALLGLAVLALALLAWKLLQPAGPELAERAATETAAPATGSNEAPAVSNGQPAEAFTLAAVIDDPDGFTNIRSGGSTKAAIVGKVLEGEKFLTYEQPGPWWRVRKADGTTGFMFRKYIRLIEGSEAAAESIAPLAPGRAFGSDLPAASSQPLTPGDIQGMNAGQLRFARNAIFARRGMRFKDPELSAYFGQFSWYNPIADTVQLSGIEKANAALLKSAEDAAQ